MRSSGGSSISYLACPWTRLEGPVHVSSFFVVRIGPETHDGMDYWCLDEAGLITRMKVLWRPLPAIAAMQHRLDAAA